MDPLIKSQLLYQLSYAPEAPYIDVTAGGVHAQAVAKQGHRIDS